MKVPLMFRLRSTIAAFSCVALIVGSTAALADPGKGQGNGKGNSQNVQNQGGQDGHGNKGKKLMPRA
ncbi:hypothetical protein ACIP66_00585 [Pseudomonas sp. NPDC088429]|uniref:hypothetical protein n=1 Tax=Pseudomonas sp. NPDC088429 TaxID=3364455 RepID=UPI003807178B